MPVLGGMPQRYRFTLYDVYIYIYIYILFHFNGDVGSVIKRPQGKGLLVIQPAPADLRRDLKKPPAIAAAAGNHHLS